MPKGIRETAKYHDELKLAFNEMPFYFLSKTFYNKLRELEVDKSYLNSGQPTFFLKKYAKNHEGQKLQWTKNSPILLTGLPSDKQLAKEAKPAKVAAKAPRPVISIETKAELITPALKGLNEPECIEFLKARGYKIYKYSEV